MRNNRLDEAEAISSEIRSLITKHNSNELKSIKRNDSKSLWKEVNRITCKSRDCGAVNSGLTAEDLNNHYARISMDTNYRAPERKK